MFVRKQGQNSAAATTNLRAITDNNMSKNTDPIQVSHSKAASRW
jgi:hypothetical protein